MTESKYVSVAEARDILGVSRPKMADMLSKGVLKWEPNPLDGRSKLLRRADVEALAAKAPPKKRSRADRATQPEDADG